jgi:hypothetical protein
MEPLHRNVLSEMVGDPETVLVDSTYAFGFAPQTGFSELGVLWGGVGKVGLFQCLWVKLHLICATNGVPLSYEYSLSKHLGE